MKRDILMSCFQMGDDVYRMVKNPHGIAYIVFIYNYDNSGCPDRRLPTTLEGYNEDFENLKILFHQLHYQVEELINPTLQVSIKTLFSLP